MASATRVDRRTRSARAQQVDAREVLLEAALSVFAERGYRHASVDEIAERAGYSKGAVYWNFDSKEDLFFSLLESRIEEPWRQSIALLETADADYDMSVEASRLFNRLVRDQRDLLLVEREYWIQAARDPKLRKRYAKRRSALREAFGKAIVKRLETLGAPPVDLPAERLGTLFMGIASGLAQEKLTEPDAVPDDLLGESYILLYLGLAARAGS